MANGTTGNLINLTKHFSDENSARELLEKLRWPNGACCPKCGGADPYRLTVKASGKNKVARQGLWKCSQCRKQFTVTVGTVFEGSHVAISKWLLAIHLMSASKKGLSAHQLHRMLGITYRAAWFINHRLRYAMATNANMFNKLTGIVETDAAFIGGKRKGGKGRVPAPKAPIVALIQRDGKARAYPVVDVTAKTLWEVIRQNACHDATLMTDEANAYQSIGTEFVKHETVNRENAEFARGAAHTNSVEGFFSLFKRGVTGSFHHISKGHLHRYLDEFTFRHNHRSKLGYDDGERAGLLVQGAEGKRLTYKQPSGASAF